MLDSGSFGNINGFDAGAKGDGAVDATELGGTEVANGFEEKGDADGAVCFISLVVKPSVDEFDAWKAAKGFDGSGVVRLDWEGC